MSQHASDRNLLFGILALQLDFIPREALIAAMHAWALDKARSLGQVLREQSALGEDEHDLLEALVDKHLAKHDHDPHKSLAALSTIGSARQALEQVADADVQASLAVVSAAHTDDPLATRAPTGEPATTPESNGPQTGLLAPSATRFRVLRPHARGGLGQVFVARDEELKREVALKEIQGRHADDPESRARFLQEAEVTGGLEHPGIVPVYSL